MSRKKHSSWTGMKRRALLLFLCPILLPLVVLAVALHFLHRAILYVLVWILWTTRGKDVLLVSSESPIWHDYMQSEVVPLVRDRAVVLNWSQRKTWDKWSLSVQVFYSFGGRREFNPLVVLFRPFRQARVLRFWSAFKDWKHGYTQSVEALRRELSLML